MNNFASAGQVWKNNTGVRFVVLFEAFMTHASEVLTIYRDPKSQNTFALEREKFVSEYTKVFPEELAADGLNASELAQRAGLAGSVPEVEALEA